jgi:integrase
LEDIDWQAGTIRVIGKGDKQRIAPLSRKTVETLKDYLRAFPHIGETGFLHRRYLPSQKGGIQLQNGQTWTAFYRENRLCPDGTIKRVLRGKAIGSLGLGSVVARNLIRELLSRPTYAGLGKNGLGFTPPYRRLSS